MFQVIFQTVMALYLHNFQSCSTTIELHWKHAEGKTSSEVFQQKLLDLDKVHCFDHSAFPCLENYKLEKWKPLFGCSGKNITVAQVSAQQALDMKKINPACVSVSPNLALQQKALVHLRLFPYCVKGESLSLSRWIKLHAKNIANQVTAYFHCQTDATNKLVAVCVLTNNCVVASLKNCPESALLDFVAKHSHGFAVCFINLPSVLRKLHLWKKKFNNVVLSDNSLLCKDVVHVPNETPSQFVLRCQKEDLAVAYLIICALCKTFQPVLNRSWVNACLLRLTAYKRQFVDTNDYCFANLCKPYGTVTEKGGYILKPSPGSVFDNCSVLDFSSYYLSLLVDRNICYSTFGCHKQAWLPDLVAQVTDPKKGFVPEPFTHKGVLPTLVTRLMNLKADTQLPVFKRLLSSIYGLLGTDLHLPQFELAMWSIAEEGRRVICNAQATAIQQGMECVCVQTDSLFLIGCSPSMCQQFCNMVCNKATVHLKQEAVYSRICFGKAFYVAVAVNGQLKSSGLFARTKASQWCKEAVLEVANNCMNCDDWNTAFQTITQIFEKYTSELQTLLPTALRSTRFNIHVPVKSSFSQTRYTSQAVVQNNRLDTHFYRATLVMYLQKLSEAFLCMQSPHVQNYLTSHHTT